MEADEVIVEARLLDRRADLGGQLGGHPLVGVDLQDPFTAAGLDAGSAPVALDRPGALDGPVGEPQGDVPGAVGATIEHDHGLVAERQRAQALVEPGLLVVGYHEGREPDVRSGNARRRGAIRHRANLVPAIMGTFHHRFARSSFGETAAARGSSQSRPPDVSGPLDPVRSEAFSAAPAGERSVSGISRAAENIMASH